MYALLYGVNECRARRLWTWNVWYVSLWADYVERAQRGPVTFTAHIGQHWDLPNLEGGRGGGGGNSSVKCWDVCVGGLKMYPLRAIHTWRFWCDWR